MDINTAKKKKKNMTDPTMKRWSEDLQCIEKRCALCGDYWPLDPEFWHRKGNGWHSYCKACVTLRCYELRHGAPRIQSRRGPGHI